MSEIEVVAKLRANADDMVSGFRRAQNAANGFQSSVTSSAMMVQRGFSMMTKSIMIGAGMMQTAAMAGASMGVKFAMANEQAIISFKTLLGSQEAAEQMFRKLQDFAATTPFEFPQLRDAASKLLTTGVSAERVIPIMTALGDSTAAMGTGAMGIQRAVYALQQMNLVGKITGQDMMQLANAGIPAWDALASAAGMSVQEVKKAVEKGTLQNSVQLLMTGIESYSGEAMGRVKGMMVEQSTTLVGLMSTLKDNVNIALADMMKPATTAIKDALPAINDAVGKTFKAMTEPVNKMVTVFMTAFQQLIPSIEPMMMALSTIMIAAVEGIVPVIAQLAGLLPQMQPALLAIGQAFTDISSVVGPLIVQVVEGLAPMLITVTTLFASMTGFIADNIGVLNALSPAIGAVVAGYLAMKAVGTVSAIIGSVKQVWAMVAAVLGLGTASQRAAIAQAQQAVAEAASAVAATGSYTAHYALAAAQSKLAVATRAATATQWSLNAAFAANPIGLTVVAIAAVVAAVVMMWKKFEWFRTGVIKIWNFIVDNIQRNVNMLLGIFNVVINAAIWFVNQLIKAWNMVSWGDDIDTLDKVNLKLDVTGLKVKEVNKSVDATNEALRQQNTIVRGLNQSLDRSAKAARESYGATAMALAHLAELEKKFPTTAKKTPPPPPVPTADTKKISERAKAIKAMTEAIRKAVMDSFSLIKAFETMTDSNNRLRDAQEDLAKAQQELEYARLRDDASGYAMALRDVAEAEQRVSQAQQNQVTFMDALRKQYVDAVKFGRIIEALRKAGLNQAGISQVIAAGVETGSKLGEEILNGGAAAVAESNAMYNALANMSALIGSETANEYFNQGRVLGDSIINGMRSALSGYVVKFSTKALTKKQMDAIREGREASVTFPISLVQAVKMAKGGIIPASTGGTLAIIGEAGRDEAVVPLPRNGEMFGGGETHIQINVYGNDPQAVVNALKKYVAVNGRLPVRAMT